MKLSRETTLSRLWKSLSVMLFALGFIHDLIPGISENRRFLAVAAIRQRHCLATAIDGSCIIMSDVDDDPSALGNIPKGANVAGKPREAERSCQDRHAQCTGFASQGECRKNPGWMIVNCAKSCSMCHLRDARVRCDRERLGINTSPSYAPGDMNSMFANISARFGDRYDVQVHSTSPWVVTFENFVSDEEADALISTQGKWQRSTDTGSMNEFGESGRVLSSGRTSQNSWCQGECERHPMVQQVYAKIKEVTGIGRENYESFQVLRYDLGQKYQVHHDYGADDLQLACGPRILTFFLYLSDVEEGGETAFPSLDIAVKPKKGRALLWPSTLDHNPEAQDARTMHEARPVLKGVKYAANAWIHLYEYMTPNLWGCTGAFDELED